MNTAVIGRDEEIAILKDAVNSNASEFIAIIGRRRIGKTYLVNQYFGKDICFYMTGLQNQTKEVQIQVFTQELNKRQKKRVSAPENWLEAFSLLKDYLTRIKTKKKKVIFIDELPWIDTPKSNFLQIFAHFWNSWAAWERNIILVIAGSSTSWIISKVFNDTGGLHNRVTKRIWLKPFTLQQTEAFLKNKNINLTKYDCTLLYMAMGGVPFYLNEVKRGESATQTIQRLFFAANGLLKTEFANLYHAIFTKADAHIRVVRTLAKYRYGLTRTELLKKAKITNSGGGSKILDELVLTNYISQMVPFGKNSNGAKYVLNDFYSLFYLSFVEGAKHRNWLPQIQTPSYTIWCGLTFERICFAHQYAINKALGISGISTTASHLTVLDKNRRVKAQIDMLIERADNYFNLCEIKFSNKIHVLSKAEAKTIHEKEFFLRSEIKKRQGVFNTMITTFGCEKNEHYLGSIYNEVTLEDLFV